MWWILIYFIVIYNMLSDSFSNLIVLFIAILLSCSDPEKHMDDILQIDIRKAETREYVNASEVVSKIEYVVLETLPQCLIGNTYRLSVSENYILVFSNPSCYLFSRTGQFIRTISQRGNGPVDLRFDYYYIKIYEQSDMVYLMNTNEICAYRISGEFVKRLKLKESKIISDSAYSSLHNITHWKDDLFCANFNLNSGKEPYRGIIFTLDGEILKLFPNFIFFENSHKGIYSGNSINYNADIYCLNEQLFFKEQLCDTLFQITDQLDLVPEIVFNLPGKPIPTNMRSPQVLLSPEYYIIHYLYATENCLLLFGTNEQLLYDKKINRLFSFKHDPLLNYEKVIPPLAIGSSTNTRTINMEGLRNDIDGGFPVWHHHMANIQHDNQLLNTFQSYLFKELLTEKHFSRQNIKDREAHQQLRNLLENLDWEDNPVLMIATFN